MTIVSLDPSLEAVLPQARFLAEIVVTALLVAIILEREMVRRRSPDWVDASGPALFALAIPIGVAWLAVVLERVLLLMTP